MNLCLTSGQKCMQCSNSLSFFFFASSNTHPKRLGSSGIGILCLTRLNLTNQSSALQYHCYWCTARSAGRQVNLSEF